MLYYARHFEVPSWTFFHMDVDVHHNIVLHLGHQQDTRLAILSVYLSHRNSVKLSLIQYFFLRSQINHRRTKIFSLLITHPSVAGQTEN